jgi:ubiquinol-cytochrome c reductase iron-sulfur subunit
MSDQHHPTPFDVDDPSLTQFDLAREGARREGVEIVHYEPRFPVPGTNEEKRVERVIALWLVIAGFSSLAFVVIYCVWKWEYVQGGTTYAWFTPLLGTTLGLALLGIGVAVIIWAKRLLPEEISIQDRHDGASPDDERKIVGATMLNMVDETGIKRRPLLKGALVLGLGPLAVAPLVPVVGAMIEDPHPKDAPLFHTGFKKGVRLVREDGTPIRPAEISAGGLETVFPGIPHGHTNRYADSPTLLIHLRPEDAEKARAKNRDLFPSTATEEEKKELDESGHFGNFYAYSKICTHAGCPASLYEQQTHRLLCPCHQSQFDVLDSCRPIFGPATRPLPQLPIEVDEEGFFVAKSDYLEAVGPAFWERP